MTSSDHDPHGTSSGQRKARSSRRRVVVIVISAIVAVVIAGAAVFFVTRGADAGPIASGSPTPVETSSETPTPSTTPSPTATPTGIALPADCEAAFSPAYFALRTEDTWNPLNDASVAGSRITTVEAAEELRASLPQLRCTWALAGEQGILSSIADVPEVESAQAMTLLAESGQDCVAHRGGTSCTVVYTNPDDGAAVAGEEHFFRDNIWIAVFWANIDASGYTDDIIDVLWGE